MSDFWSTVQEAADNAPEAGYAKLNFGRLEVNPMAVSWTTTDELLPNGKNKRVPVKRPFAEGATLKEGEGLEFDFTVFISELNENIQFDYNRNVPIRKSGKTKTDWTEIVEPSLIAVFGKQWAQAFKKKDLYVLVEDVPNVAGKAGSNGTVYGVPKFLKLFKNKAACEAERNETYKPRDGASTTTSPEEEDNGPAITADTLKKVQGLLDSVGEKKAKTMLAGKPFGDFDPDTLIELAKAAAKA